MNVLLTSAGRRYYLVEYFRSALRGRGKVLAADADANAPALQAADRAFVVPRFTDESYFGVLRDLCLRYNVHLVISLNDLELPLLARKKREFEVDGVTLLVSEPEIVDACLDKWRCYRMLRDAGIRTPRTFHDLRDAKSAAKSGELAYPLVVKPRWGTASLGVEFVYSEEELDLAYRLLSQRLRRTILAEVSAIDSEHAILVQERIVGTEYGLDIVNNLQGDHVVTFVKQKLSMRAGETDKAMTVADPRLERIGAKIASVTRHVAILDCDVIVDHEGHPAVIELNPRFGGGYPFSHVAGADVPAAIIAWMTNRQPEMDWLTVQPQVVAAKYDRVVVTSPVDESDHGDDGGISRSFPSGLHH